MEWNRRRSILPPHSKQLMFVFCNLTRTSLFHNADKFVFFGFQGAFGHRTSSQKPTKSQKQTHKTYQFNWCRSPAGSYLFKVNNGNIWTMCEICSQLTKYSIFNKLWTDFAQYSIVSIVDFEQVNTGRVWYLYR